MKRRRFLPVTLGVLMLGAGLVLGNAGGVTPARAALVTFYFTGEAGIVTSENYHQGERGFGGGPKVQGSFTFDSHPHASGEYTGHITALTLYYGTSINTSILHLAVADPLQDSATFPPPANGVGGGNGSFHAGMGLDGTGAFNPWPVVPPGVSPGVPDTFRIDVSAPGYFGDTSLLPPSLNSTTFPPPTITFSNRFNAGSSGPYSLGPLQTLTLNPVPLPPQSGCLAQGSSHW